MSRNYATYYAKIYENIAIPTTNTEDVYSDDYPKSVCLNKIMFFFFDTILNWLYNLF